MNSWQRVMNQSGSLANVSAPYPKFIQTDIAGKGNCEKPSATVVVIYNPTVTKTEFCKIDGLGGEIPNLVTDIPSGINIFNTVKIGFTKGYDQLQSEYYEDAKIAFTDVANFDSEVPDNEDFMQSKTFTHAAISLSQAVEGGFLSQGENRSSSTLLGTDVIRPNPTDGLTYIVLPEDRTECKINIWGTYGKLIQTLSITESADIDVSSWENGFYIVELVGDDKHRAIRYKMLVQHP
jgi:Secretion system C-terminal sorting domain